MNLAGKQLQNESLVDELGSALASSGIDPSALALEITEDLLMEHAEEAQTVLNRLKSQGIRLYLDDFGTGYSSLAYLRSFPLDALKIDRSFVSSMDTQAGDSEIVRTIMTLATNLDLGVVAEGIENRAQLEALKTLG